MMKRMAWVGAAAVALCCGVQARASGPIAVYAVIEKVVLGPSAKAPVHAQVWGTFMVAKGSTGRAFRGPVYGFFYYAAPSGKEDVCRKEWADLKKMAGTGKVVGFGERGTLADVGRLRGHGEEAKEPDPYPLHFGLIRLGGAPNWSPVKELLNAPAPYDPTEGALVPSGKITLTARKVLAKDRASASYQFELVSPDGAHDESPIVKAGKTDVKWSPKTALKPGGKYIWRVWAVEGKWTGPMAETRFVVKGK